MARVPLTVGDVFAFKAGESWFACQVIGPGSLERWELVVFDVASAELPDTAIIDGAGLYVIRRGKPRNQPMYLVCGGAPPETFQQIGNRPVELAFPLPESYSTT